MICDGCPKLLNCPFIGFYSLIVRPMSGELTGDVLAVTPVVMVHLPDGQTVRGWRLRQDAYFRTWS